MQRDGILALNRTVKRLHDGQDGDALHRGQRTDPLAKPARKQYFHVLPFPFHFARYIDLTPALAQSVGYGQPVLAPPGGLASAH